MINKNNSNRDRTKGELSLVGRIIAYENGELDDEGVIKLFRELVRTGMAWKLQGHYGRTAQRMIEAGLIRG